MNENKKIKNNFKKIIGISNTKLNKICKHFGVKNSIKFLKLPNKLKAQIKNYIENNIEIGEAIIIKKVNQIDIYTKIGTYRGSRALNEFLLNCIELKLDCMRIYLSLNENLND
jgi:ribosomal protein S13